MEKKAPTDLQVRRNDFKLKQVGRSSDSSISEERSESTKEGNDLPRAIWPVPNKGESLGVFAHETRSPARDRGIQAPATVQAQNASNIPAKSSVLLTHRVCLCFGAISPIDTLTI